MTENLKKDISGIGSFIARREKDMEQMRSTWVNSWSEVGFEIAYPDFSQLEKEASSSSKRQNKAAKLLYQASAFAKDRARVIEQESVAKEKTRHIVSMQENMTILLEDVLKYSRKTTELQDELLVISEQCREELVRVEEDKDLKIARLKEEVDQLRAQSKEFEKLKRKVDLDIKPLYLEGKKIRNRKFEWTKEDSSQSMHIKDGNAAAHHGAALADATLYLPCPVETGPTRLDVDTYINLYGVAPDYALSVKDCGDFIDILNYRAAVKDFNDGDEKLYTVTPFHACSEPFLESVRLNPDTWTLAALKDFFYHGHLPDGELFEGLSDGKAMYKKLKTYFHDEARSHQPSQR